MITLFAVPKPFSGHIGTIQRNALNSWRRALPDAQILLFGGETGIAEAAYSIGAQHLHDMSLNGHGTPMLSDVFDRTTAAARHDLTAFINSDIMLLSDFRTSLDLLPREPFVMIGQCRDVRVEEPISFGGPDIDAKLKRLWQSGGRRGALGMDYFVMPRGLFGTLPPFAIGRACYDNWMVWRARELGAMVVDASKWVTALHQVHDYGHLGCGMRESRTGPEARENRKLAGRLRYIHLYSILDSTHALGPDGLRPRPLHRIAFLRQLWLRFALLVSGH